MINIDNKSATSTDGQIQSFKGFVSIVLDDIETVLNRRSILLKRCFSQDIEQTSKFLLYSPDPYSPDPYSQYSLNNWAFMSLGIHNARSEIHAELKKNPDLKYITKKDFGNINYDVQYLMNQAKKHLDSKTFSKLENGEMILQWNLPKLMMFKKFQNKFRHFHGSNK